MSLKSRNRAANPRQTARREDWCTPRGIIEGLKDVFGQITLDPCDNPQSQTDALTSIMLPKYRRRCRRPRPRQIFGDGLRYDWAAEAGVGRGVIYVNYPFSRENNPVWMSRCAGVGQSYPLALLCPAAVGQNWFNPAWGAAAIGFLKRLRFLGAPSIADFDCALVVWAGDVSWGMNKLAVARQLRRRFPEAAWATQEGLYPRQQEDGRV